MPFGLIMGLHARKRMFGPPVTSGCFLKSSFWARSCTTNTRSLDFKTDVQKLRSYGMVQLPTKSSSQAFWFVLSCRRRARVASVKTCCSCGPKSEIKACWAFNRQVPSWANAVRVVSRDACARNSVDGVSRPTCCRVSGFRRCGGKYLDRQGVRSRADGAYCRLQSRQRRRIGYWNIYL